MTSKESAEEGATAFRRMAMSIRKMALYDEKKKNCFKKLDQNTISQIEPLIELIETAEGIQKAKEPQTPKSTWKPSSSEKHQKPKSQKEHWSLIVQFPAVKVIGAK